MSDFLILDNLRRFGLTGNVAYARSRLGSQRKIGNSLGEKYFPRLSLQKTDKNGMRNFLPFISKVSLILKEKYLSQNVTFD
jgi:hypothetical protein